MSSRFLSRATVFCLYLLLVLTPLFYFRQGVYPYAFSKMLFFQGLAELVFFFWLPLLIFDKRYRPRRSVLLRALAFFFVVLVVTGVFGIDPWRSFWSIQERSLGIVTFLHLLVVALALSVFLPELYLGANETIVLLLVVAGVLFGIGFSKALLLFLLTLFVGVLGAVLSTTRKESFPKQFLYTSLLTSVFVGVLAFSQLWDQNLLVNEAVGSRPGSTFGNPTFLAGYSGFHFFLALYFFVRLFQVRGDEKERRSHVSFFEIGFLVATLLLNAYTIFQAQTRGDILGLGVGMLTLLTLFALTPPRVTIPFFKKRVFYGAFLIAIVLFGAGFWATRSSAVWSHVPGLSRFQTVSLSGGDLEPRLIALRAAWAGFLERPTTGWGWDNFNIVFNKHYDPRALEVNYGETRFDKPHNFILEYLVVGGLPLLAAFLALFGAFLYMSFYLRDRLFGQIMIAALAAYFVRTLFVFDTLGPLLIFFVFLGITHGFSTADFSRNQKDTSTRNNERRPQGEGQASVAVASGVVGAVLVVVVNVLPLQASYYQFWGFQYFVKNKIPQAVDSFKTAVNAWTPYAWNFKRDYAAAVSEAYFYNPGLVPKDDAWDALHAMESVAREHPLDAYNHYALVDMYNQVSDLDKAALLPMAEKEGAIALTLSPQRQEVYFSLAKTKSLEGDSKAAIAEIKKGLALDDKVPDAHFYYGLLAFNDGDATTGYTEIHIALTLGRAWKNNNEPRVVANFLADSGHLDEAIALYQKAIAMKPDDLEANVKLGIAYFFAGDKDKARQFILATSKKVDLTKSSAYPDLEPILHELGIHLTPGILP